MNNTNLKECKVCPRECGVDRTKTTGFCRQSNKIRIARADLHMWEEPCISGTKGSGTVFFSGCSLKCIYCQNFSISNENMGYEVTKERLAEIMLELQNKGAHNINLVNPTHFTPQIIECLESIKDKLKIPVVYNCSGYEKTETIKLLKGYIDIFLTDFKYFDNELANKLSLAPDYFEVASKAIKEMISITGKPIYKDDILQKGTIIRHLVLPGFRTNSIELIKHIKNIFEDGSYILSVMSQYTPIHTNFEIKSLNRSLSTFEYNSVLEVIDILDLDGYIQEFSSSDTKYIPEFYDKDLQ